MNKPFHPTPEQLAELGYLLSWRKKCGSYYHHSKQVGAHTQKYSVGLMTNGTINFSGWDISPHKGVFVTSIEDFKDRLITYGLPLGPPASISAGLPQPPALPDPLAAYRQQVATELNKLQGLTGAVSDSELFDATAAAAARLGIDLPAPSPTSK